MEKFNLEALGQRLKKASVETASALRDLLNDIDSKEENLPDGPLGARGRLEALFDKGTFSETGTYVRRRVSEFDETVPDEFEGVICGWGSVNGKLVYAFSQDLKRARGSISEAHAKKICNIYRLAVENGAPIIGIFDSDGVFLPEGVRAIAGYGAIMKCAAKASGVIPQIAIIPGYACGANAVIAGMFDFIISTESGSVSVNPPFITEGVGKAAYAADTGVSAVRAHNDVDAIAKVKRLLDFLPSNNVSGSEENLSSDEINRQIDISSYTNGESVKTLIKAFADDGKYLELYSEYASEVSTGFISIGGIPAGIIACDSAVKGGVLTAKAARKAARMVSLLDGFNIPIITIVDSSGLDTSEESEKSPYVAELSKLANAYAVAETPMITLITGQAYGSVFSIMGSKAIGADTVLALDSAKIGSMNAASAVAFLWNNKITGDVKRENLEEEWNSSVNTPVEAASSGEIDDIISSAEIRQRIAANIYMLSLKSRSELSRRHLIMPL